MGCMSSKSAAVEDSRENQKQRLTRKGSLEKLVPRANSSRREEVVRSEDKYDGGDVKVLLINRKTSSGSNRFCYDDEVEKRIFEKFEVIDKNKEEKCEVITAAVHHPNPGRVINSVEGEQVAAGWPSWLVTVAGEAIKGWIPRRANTFEKLDKVGSFCLV